jgi:hypothetical protein
MAVKSTQMCVATPTTTTRETSSETSSASRLVDRKPEWRGFST